MRPGYLKVLNVDGLLPGLLQVTSAGHLPGQRVFTAKRKGVFPFFPVSEFWISTGPEF